MLGTVFYLLACNALAGFQQDNSGQGIVVAEAENFHTNTPQGSHNWFFVSNPVGFSGTGAMRALPQDGARLRTNYASNSPRLDYQIDFITPGTHYVWVRGACYGGGTISVHAGLDNQEIPSSSNLSLSKNLVYVWVQGSINVPSNGTHTLNI